MASPQKNQLSISTLSIIKVVLVLLAFYVLYLIGNIVAMLFISFVLFSAINPIVNRLREYHVPRPLGVIIIYLVLFAVISSVFILITPHVVEQAKGLIQALPGYLEKTFANFSELQKYSVQYGLVDNIKQGLEFLQQGVSLGAKGIFSIIASIFGGVASFFIILVITFYMIAEKDAIYSFLNNAIPEAHRKRAMSLIESVQEKLGLWARAQLILSFVIFLLIFIFLSIFKIKYALVLALIAGLTEFIPYLGPIIGAIPAVIIAFFQSPVNALIVIVIYYAVQQIENTILVPQIMRKAVGINPVISITALMAGLKLGGIFGAILAIPVVVTLGVILNSILEKRESQK